MEAIEACTSYPEEKGLNLVIELMCNGNPVVIICNCNPVKDPYILGPFSMLYGQS
jgi:hypothetical protein